MKSIIVTAIVVLAGALVSCGGGIEDPEESYGRLVKAAEDRDYGYLYDVLDRDMRQNVDSLVEMSRRSAAQMPPAEKKFWDSLGKASSRDAFIAMMRRDTSMTAALRGQYKVLHVDTMMVLTIQRGSRPAELWYFQAEGGKLRVSDPPRAPRAEMPQNHPPVEPMTPPPGGPQAPSQAPSQAPQGGDVAPDTGARR